MRHSRDTRDTADVASGRDGSGRGKFEERLDTGRVTMYCFRLKPSTIAGAGVGVFATADIPRGTLLRELFDADDVRRLTWEEFATLDVPSEVKENFVIRYETECFVPRCFNRLSVGWFLNDSESPNLAHDANYDYYAIRDIAAGEELLIRYDDL